MLSRRFRLYGADWKRSLFQLITTATPFLALLAIMAMVSDGRYWLTLLLAIPTAGLLVRLFIIQHDCGHGSFFKSRAANDLVGRALCLLTLTPYGNWRQGHAMHHAANGNLDRRGRGDVETLTVAEYEASAPLKKLGYRLYRNPFVMVLLGAPVNFILLQRLPTGRAFRDRDSRRSIMSLNLALVVAFGLPMALIGVVPVLATYLPVMIVASWIGTGCFTSSISSKTHIGSLRPTGISTQRRSAAAPISNFRPCCSGSVETSDCTTFITCAAAFRTIACRPAWTQRLNCIASRSG